MKSIYSLTARIIHEPSRELVSPPMSMLIGLLVILLAGSSMAPGTAREGTRVVFLTQDVAEGFDHAGATPDLLEPLKTFVRKEYPNSIVPLDLHRLLDAGIKPYYIYNKRYCAPIGRELGANLFVMSRLVMTGPTAQRGDFLYTVEAKAYSSSTGRESVFLSAERVAGANLQGLVIGREQELWQAILAVAQEQASVETRPDE